MNHENAWTYEIWTEYFLNSQQLTLLSLSIKQTILYFISKVGIYIRRVAKIYSLYGRVEGLFLCYTDNPIMGDKSVLLVDFDETIFPFSATYLRWVKGHYPGTKTVTSQILSKELIKLPIHLQNMRHKLHLEKFVNNHDTLEIPPRQDATESLLLLSQKYRIVCCTNRRNMRGTIQWVEKHYSHIIEGVEHVEDSAPTGKKINTLTITKKYIVEKTRAAALIDDFAFNLWRLPRECRGFVVKREPPMPSDLGALSWSDIAKCLT